MLSCSCFTFRSRAVVITTGILILSQILVGCGKKNEGPARFRVSGKVTFNGAPVPCGGITFDSNATASEGGQQGYAEIKDGLFDTAIAGQKGVIGGATTLTISGSERPIVVDGPDPGILFSNYVMKHEFPQEVTTLDIEIPAEAAGKNARKK